jgi:hypothetical protein
VRCYKLFVISNEIASPFHKKPARHCKPELAQASRATTPLKKKWHESSSKGMRMGF